MISVFVSSITLAQGNEKIVWLSTLDMSRMAQGSGTAKIDTISAIKPLTISRQIFKKGISTLPKSYVWIDVGDADKFSSYVGIDDDMPNNGEKISYKFKIYGDEKLLWQSAEMHKDDSAEKVDINIKGVKKLILVVVNLNNNESKVQADWGDAYFTTNGSSPKTIDPPRNASIILTPKPDAKAKINGPKVYGCRPNNPFLYRIPATGVRPIIFSADNLPEGLSLNTSTGIITGLIMNKGEYTVTLKAKNAFGKSSRLFKIICGDKLALTPTMGWNTWYAYYGNINDKLMRDAADSMISNGMADAGYQYVDIDDCWANAEKSNDKTRVGTRRDPDGNILPNSNFPDMKTLTDYIHSKGLKTGIYSSPGLLTCATYTGSYDHEAKDAKRFAEWGFDLLKYDWCSYAKIAKNTSDSERQKPYRLMGSILQQQHRDIIFNLCQYGMNSVWKWGAEVGGQSWRTGGDLGYRLNRLFEIAKRNAELGIYVQPGAWNDPDYIQIGYVGNTPTKLIPEEQYSFMSLWCLLAAPLIYSGSLNKIDDFTLSILCNNEAIDINQDPLGKAAKVISKTDETFIMIKELEEGNKAIGLCNNSEIPVSITLLFKDAGLTGKQFIRNVWRHKNLGVFSKSFTATVPRHGVVLVKVGKIKNK